MQIRTYPLPANAPRETIQSSAVAVIDTLRLTSTATTALASGCRALRAFAGIEEAEACARSYPSGEALLGGERNALPIPGFALSNSPLEYTEEAVSGKTVLLTTTNGTRAIAACEGAPALILACFLNRSAVARALAVSGHDAVLVCAGTEGAFSLEDTLTAGAIIEAMQKIQPDALRLDDLSQAAYLLYAQSKDDLHAALRPTRHYQRLEKSGYADDLDFCLRLDIFSVVPTFSGGVIA